jgi:hypothetical protein
MRRVTGILLAALVVPGVWGMPAQAQVGPDVPTLDGRREGLEIRIIPRFGLFSPDAYLYEEFANFSGDGPVEWTTGSLGRAAFAAVGLEVGYPHRGILLRGEVGRSFEGWLSAVHGILIPRVLFEPPQVVNTWLDVPASVTFLNLQVVLPTRFEVRGIRPYVLGGFSGKWYGFGTPTTENSVEAILPSDGWTPSAQIGGGATFGLFGLVFELQMTDSINRYWDKTQHDLIFSGGLIWRIR